jgi:DNA-binding response OmpR family regulator
MEDVEPAGVALMQKVMIVDKETTGAALMQKVLIVDDEPDVVNGLAMNLQREGYHVLKANDADTAIKLVIQEHPQLVILDVMMPGKSGLEVCQAIRQKEIDTRIIMLSARAEEIDRVVGLRVGADDYVAKPFSTRELIALIHARLRYRSAAAVDHVAKYRIDDIEIDFEKCLAARNGVPVELTPREFEILHYLIQHRTQVVSRDQILEKIWGRNTFTTIRTVDNHILRLRKKLEPDPAKPQFILSIYGGGYKFVG